MGTKTMRVTVVLMAAMAVAGCGTDGTGLGEDGTGGAASATATGGTIGAGGQGGSAPAGTGGAPVAAGGTIGSDFTRADHDMCVNWPVCPDDVFSIRTDTGRILSPTCTAFDGGRVSCAGCLRRSTCEHFTGRCIAPFLLTANTTGWYVSNVIVPECRAFLDSNPPVVADSWAICTGDTGVTTIDSSGAPQVGVAAKTVCQD